MGGSLDVDDVGAAEEVRCASTMEAMVSSLLEST